MASPPDADRAAVDRHVPGDLARSVTSLVTPLVTRVVIRVSGFAVHDLLDDQVEVGRNRRGAAGGCVHRVEPRVREELRHRTGG